MTSVIDYRMYKFQTLCSLIYEFCLYKSLLRKAKNIGNRRTKNEKPFSERRSQSFKINLH